MARNRQQKRSTAAVEKTGDALKAPNINIFFAGILIDELVRRGITDFCISPGSRSTPLTIAASDHASANIYVNLDERASAYYALGYARGSGKAAAVVCTSGTAAANMFPAVIEAHYSRLPIVILSADRPEELQNCGAHQTINQENLFGQYATSVTIPAPTNESDPLALLNDLDKVLKGADAPSSPIHINCRFREPLAPTDLPYAHERMQEHVDEWRCKYMSNNFLDATASRTAPGKITFLINRKSRGLIIAGPETPFRACRLIGELSEKLKWPIAADILSQYRFSSRGHILSHYDLYLDHEEIVGKLSPEIVLHIGGLPTSKRLNGYLLKHKGIEYIKLQDHDRDIDPDHLESERLLFQSDKSLERVIAEVESLSNSEYCRSWIEIENATARFLEDYISGSRLTESSLAIRMGEILGDGQALFLSSSMPVRDADTFIRGLSKDIIVGANRGVNGIDGVIASACGFAAGCRRPTILVIGDLAFIHDLNSLALVKRSDVPLVIIVINNNGGGIFHFLPVAHSTEKFEEFFATPHGLSFKNAADIFDLPYYHPGSMTEFDDCRQKTIKTKKSAIIEITSYRKQNAKEHEEIRSDLKNIFSEQKADF